MRAAEASVDGDEARKGRMQVRTSRLRERGGRPDERSQGGQREYLSPSPLSVSSVDLTHEERRRESHPSRKRGERDAGGLADLRAASTKSNLLSSEVSS